MKAVAAPEPASPLLSPAGCFQEGTLRLMHTCRADLGHGLRGQHSDLLGSCGMCGKMLEQGEKGGRSSMEQPAPSGVSSRHLPIPALQEVGILASA